MDYKIELIPLADPAATAGLQQIVIPTSGGFEIADPATSRVEIPFEGSTLPAYFSNASKDGEPVPCVIMWNGLDSTKEHMYTSGWAQEMRERGVSVLVIDNPGSGEALRFQDLKSRIESEDWATAQIDWLETRSDVDADRIGLVGWSLSGYYVPRAAAYEKRIKLIAVWGANHNWGEVQKRRLKREGENDRQISVDYAHQSYDQAVNSPKRELRIFTVEEGAAEHVGLDHMPHINAYVADWVEDTLAELD